MELNNQTLYGFSGSLLSQGFDNPQPTPSFHLEMWDMCLRPDRYVAIAAPRGHAKSSAITHAYVLASVLFRNAGFVMIVSDTEGQAVQFLGNIKAELQNNKDLRELFGISKFLKDTDTEIVVRTTDKHQFKIIAKGSNQKVRGTIWLNKRPDLIVVDDFENEELTANKDRREKLRQWFFGALVPTGSDNCKIRMVGTVLHLDSLLERLLNDSAWLSKRYEAHNDDFSEILWPEKFPKGRLLDIKSSYENQGFPEGYMQEYRNWPIDPTNSYFMKDDFLESSEDELDKPMRYYGAVDFAISQKERSDRTVITVGGVDSNNMLHIVYVNAGRWDAKEIVDNMLLAQQRFNLDMMTVETGMIEKAIGPYLKEEMLRQNIFISLNKMTPTKDKETRARSIQARMRAGGVKFDKSKEWYKELESEMLVFPKGKHDDIVDSVAWLGQTIDKFATAPTEEEYEEELWEDEYEETYEPVGLCATTGY